MNFDFKYINAQEFLSTALTKCFTSPNLICNRIKYIFFAKRVIDIFFHFRIRDSHVGYNYLSTDVILVISAVWCPINTDNSNILCIEVANKAMKQLPSTLHRHSTNSSHTGFSLRIFSYVSFTSVHALQVLMETHCLRFKSLLLNRTTVSKLTFDAIMNIRYSREQILLQNTTPFPSEKLVFKSLWRLW